MKRIIWIGLVIMFTIGITGCGSNPVLTLISSYSIQNVYSGNNLERRLYLNDHHFLSIITTSEGAISIRPHPGEDVNGWGSSLYLQPFLPGATLRNTVIESAVSELGRISLKASGKVSKGNSETYGNWNLNIRFVYDHSAKKVSGSGTYTINLNTFLSNATGDLNLFKLASNYLSSVPLLSGGTGDTGDMRRADVTGQNISFSWSPPALPSYFPNNITDNLTIDIIGDYNNVDTVAQGYARIEPAQKPGIKITLNSHNAGINMIFGAIYDTAKNKDFWEDNVGITPLILKKSTALNYVYNVEFESTP